MPSPSHALPSVAGIGLRHAHMADMIERRPAVGWLEVHAENLMQHGPATTAVERLRSHYPLSVHGVGLSLGSAAGIDPAHLARLKAVVDRFQPALVSEHLAWCVGDGIYLNDLLPVPHDEEALAVVAANIDQVQEALGRPILIENLSAYVGFARSTMEEPDFLAELARRTGCGLLLDINNVIVSAHNLGFDAGAYIARLPIHAIGEIHLAGHATNDTADGTVLIDDHGSRVPVGVWSLYAETVGRLGPRPTLIEWDSALPPLNVLIGEAMHADMLLACLSFHASLRASRCAAAELAPHTEAA
ncbi:MAG TPA: DUF692 domain-containing protein [Sphingomicrobium sp.]